MTIEFQWLAQVVAEKLLNSIVQGILVGVCAWSLLQVLERQNSGTRFAVWFFVLLTIGVLPFAGLIGTHHILPLAPSTSSRLVLPGRWASFLFAAWALPAGFGCLKIAVGFWQVWRVRRNCTRLDRAALPSVLATTLNNFGASRPVTFCVSDHVRVPTAIGFFIPAIVVPTWAMEEMTPAQLNSIALHELAHIRRWDDWTNLLQKIVRALFFFHPAVWWLERKLSLEREAACDDMVIAETKDARAYAECLVTVAEKGLLHRGTLLAQAVVGRMRHMSLRLARVLDKKRATSTHVMKPALVGVAIIAVSGVVLLPHAPKLIAFEDGRPAVSVSATPLASPANPLSERADRNLRSQVVNAKWTEPTKSGTKTLTGKMAGRRKSGHGRFIQPKQMQESQRAPLPARADFSMKDTFAQEVLVVMESEQSTAAGALRWSVCVWRLTIIQTSDNPAQKENLPKKI